MSKYIELTLALNKLWRLCEEDIDAEIAEAFDFSRAKEALQSLPIIDIVICEECRWQDDCSQVVENIEGTAMTLLRWCSDGERIDND